MPSKRQVFVASSNTVPDPHLEVESDIFVSLVTSFNVGRDPSSPKESYLSNPPPITTAPPITTKIAKTPIIMKRFFLFPLLELFSIESLDNFLVSSSGNFLVSSSASSSFTSGFLTSQPQLRQNLELTGIDFPHFQQ